MAAETGSGKTGAFCLPILQIVWETLKDMEAGKDSSRSTARAPQGTIYFSREYGLSVEEKSFDRSIFAGRLLE